MKATVENLSSTRVKLSVEVPFEELAPSVDAAYKRLSRQVKVQGFRPGKVPPRILDQRLGRATVLEEALQDALPRFYAAAVEEQNVDVVSRPEMELDSFSDGESLVFSATVDVRPEIELASYDGLAVTVPDAVAADEDIDRQLSSLQDRFAVLSAVERSVESGDYVLLDLKATVGDEIVPGSEAAGLSYEVGSGGLIPGLDEALIGRSTDETAEFDSAIAFGDFAGQTAHFTVTVRAVKVKQVPPLDDDFAQTASEFDTLDELRADVAERLSRMARLDQAVQAREATLDALLERTEIPLPESMVESEVSWRQQRMLAQLAQAGLDPAAYYEQSGQTEEDLLAGMRASSQQAVKAQLLLDHIAEKEEVGVTDGELTEQVIRRAQRAGMSPNELAQRLANGGQLGALVAEVRRGKALALVLEAAEVTDASGRPVDLSALEADAPAPAGVESLAGEAELAEHDEHEGHDHDHEGHDHHHH